MKIGFVQVATQLGQPEKNRVQLEIYVNQAAEENVDTIVFPEMWNVGFFPENVEELAEDVQDICTRNSEIVFQSWIGSIQLSS